jgi:hypothetical protein
METIIASLDDMTTDELRQVLNYCNNIIKIRSYDSKSKLFKNVLNNSRYNKQDFLKMYDNIEILNLEYERVGYHVATIKSIKIGNITFIRHYDGNNEGYGTYYFGMRDDMVSVELFDEGTYDDLNDISFKNENYGKDLHEIYKNQEFTKVKKNDFLDFVSYVFTDAMDTISYE